jgi:hypothetical protein
VYLNSKKAEISEENTYEVIFFFDEQEKILYDKDLIPKIKFKYNENSFMV